MDKLFNAIFSETGLLASSKAIYGNNNFLPAKDKTGVLLQDDFEKHLEQNVLLREKDPNDEYNRLVDGFNSRKASLENIKSKLNEVITQNTALQNDPEPGKQKAAKERLAGKITHVDKELKNTWAKLSPLLVKDAASVSSEEVDSLCDTINQVFDLSSKALGCLSKEEKLTLSGVMTLDPLEKPALGAEKSVEPNKFYQTLLADWESRKPALACLRRKVAEVYKSLAKEEDPDKKAEAQRRLEGDANANPPTPSFSEAMADLEADWKIVESLLSPPIIAAVQSSGDPEVDGLFQEVVIRSSSSTESAAQSAATEVKSGGWSVSGWFFSAGASSSSSSGESAQASAFYKQDIEIGFRIAKVSFDRGGWFNPSIFKMSKSFYHLADMRVAGGLTADKVKDTVDKAKVKTQEDLKILQT